MQASERFRVNKKEGRVRDNLDRYLIKFDGKESEVNAIFGQLTRRMEVRVEGS